MILKGVPSHSGYSRALKAELLPVCDRFWKSRGKNQDNWLSLEAPHSHIANPTNPQGLHIMVKQKY